MARPSDAGDQKFEIALFTCAFLAGGLFIITVILAAFMNPSLASDVTSLEASYKDQGKLLRSPEMKSLRAQAKVSEGQDNRKTLRDIIDEQYKNYGLEMERFLAAQRKKVSAGIEEIPQQIVLQPAKLVNILQFVAAVQEAKKSIQVESVRLTRPRRGRDKELADSWQATVDFVDYVAK
jgi:hypothetical protein